KIYQGTGAPGPAIDSGYGWAVCPTFYECLSTQASHMVASTNVIHDAKQGVLPALSFVTPTGSNSQHNGYSMLVGDNWIGKVMSAIENGPDWASTAVIITYDDCGCFYDHVNPLVHDPTWGIRLPLVIVSPYAKQGFTDSTPTTVMGILAFVEHTYGLAPLVANLDGAAYDFSDSFDYSQSPTHTVPMVVSHVPRSELARVRPEP